MVSMQIGLGVREPFWGQVVSWQNNYRFVDLGKRLPLPPKEFGTPRCFAPPKNFEWPRGLGLIWSPRRKGNPMAGCNCDGWVCPVAPSEQLSATWQLFGHPMHPLGGPPLKASPPNPSQASLLDAPPNGKLKSDDRRRRRRRRRTWH